MIVYGRNPVREALRGRRPVRRVWATARAAREPWLDGVDVASLDAERARARVAARPTHQGIVRARSSPIPTRTPRGCSRAPDPLIVALDEVQDPQNLGAICRTAECAGATGVVLPERRVGRGDAGGRARRRRARSSTCAVARVRNLADFLGDAKEAGCWCYGAAAERAARYDQPDYRGGVVLVLGAEGAGLRPRVAAACDALSRCPSAAGSPRSTSAPPPPSLLYEILQRREPRG